MAARTSRNRVKRPMKKSPHVGRIIRQEVIEPLDLTITAAADALGVTRANLSNLLNEKLSLTWEMAIKIEKAFGPHAAHLMRMQFAYDQAAASARAGDITVKRVIKAPAP